MKNVDPQSIVMMEDHDRAYYAWKERGFKSKTLVHVDAHIDFGWIPDMDFDEIGFNGGEPEREGGKRPLVNPFLRSRKKMMHIGNYIYPAMRDGIVEKFYWVVPEASLRTARGRRYIVKSLCRLLKITDERGGLAYSRNDVIRCYLAGREVIVCDLKSLAKIDSPVLLDIDVDFMVTKFIWDGLNPERMPWIFPEELREKISDKVKYIDLLTIAYSVEGGYTPLRFKYLGDELRLIYSGDISDTACEVMRSRAQAIAKESRGEIKEAYDIYKKALITDGEDASLYFNMAIFYMRFPEKFDSFEAAACLKEAIKKDKAYTTAYNNYGILYLGYDDLKSAENGYKNFLNLDDTDTTALNSLGHVFLARKKYVSAVEYFEKCLEIDSDHAGALYGKGIIFFMTGMISEARELFLKIKTDSPDDCDIYWWLGRIAEKTGEKALAIENYKNAVAYGEEGPLAHLILVRLYISRAMYYRAFEELKRFFQMLRSVI